MHETELPYVLSPHAVPRARPYDAPLSLSDPELSDVRFQHNSCGGGGGALLHE
jgi:hypothetical protein